MPITSIGKSSTSSLHEDCLRCGEHCDCYGHGGFATFGGIYGYMAGSGIIMSEQPV